MPDSSWSIAAAYLFPVEEDPIPDAYLTIGRNRILEYGPRRGRPVELDLGAVAIVPGFCNVHTHLELERLYDDPAPKDPVADPIVEDQITWLERVIEHRAHTDTTRYRSTVTANLRAAMASGTTLLADITTAGQSWEAVLTAPIRANVYAEVLGLSRIRGFQSSHEAWQWIDQVDEAEALRAGCRIGLSPHAPYSTAQWIYHRAAETGMPLATHLAELPEEIELLATGEGRLRTFLENLGAWPDDWEPLGPRPADYVRGGRLRQADWLIAHGTYLDSEDYWQLRPEAAPNHQRVVVVYCPRTHARFGHRPHPYREMLERGIMVALGTDSLASTASLSVLDEIRFLRRRDPEIDGSILLRMATLHGAWGLRLEGLTGSLKPGKSADLAVIPISPDLNVDDPHDLIFRSVALVRATMFAGRFVAGPSEWRGVPDSGT